MSTNREEHLLASTCTGFRWARAMPRAACDGTAASSKQWWHGTNIANLATSTTLRWKYNSTGTVS